MYSVTPYFAHLVLILLLCIQAFGRHNQQPVKYQRNVTNIVLVGATGDLAERYLWQGFFKLFTEETTDRNTFRFYATARDVPETGKTKIDSILAGSLKCSGSEHACGQEKRAFAEVVQYHSLTDEKDYSSLCHIIAENLKPEDQEKGRIFYLSVPPFAYIQIAKRIHTFCRNHGDQTWTRLVLEKPFGSDFTSAQELAKNMAEYFQEREIYRIDHYLGKRGVTQILDFRFNYHDMYEDLWNSNHIERVEIVLKERGDCKGRTNFYNHYGIVRDVMQNHMTELLVMVAMEMPNSKDNQTSVMQSKLRLLREIKPMNRWSGIIGQYKQYNTHYSQEKGQDKTADFQRSNTPTFAAVSVFINNARWEGVPFILVSGKQLEERTAYVRIVFKQNVHRLCSNSVKSDNCGIRQIVFNIQGEKLKEPAVLISGVLPKPKLFQPLQISMENKTGEHFGCSVTNFQALIQNDSTDAYATLISAIYHERKNLFVGTEDLLTSWKVWSHFLDSLNYQVPRQYDQESLDLLEFVSLGEHIEFYWNDENESCNANGMCQLSEKSTDHYNLETFRNHHLVTGKNTQVVRALAVNILNNALRAVSLSGVFHLALSGGTSPLMLYETLAFRTKSFPWQHTHIWMTDERCVPLMSEESNFHMIYEKLLRHVPISHFNIHPMYIMLKSGLCDLDDKGPEHYEAELRRFLVNHHLDFVVLGVGSDGHTASLFPHQSILNNKENWISLTESDNSYKVKRISMTFSLLNNAKALGVLALGNHKQDIVKTLSTAEVDAWNYPVTGIQPNTGDLTWYIDNEALGRK